MNFSSEKIYSTIKKSKARIMSLKVENAALTERNISISKQLKAEEKRRLFAESHMTFDKQKLLEVTHLTTIWAGIVEYTLERLLGKIKNHPEIVGDDLLEETDHAHMLMIKMRKLSRIITKTNFGMMTDSAELDIFSYVEQYIEEINSIGPYVSNLKISFKNKKSSRLDLTMSAIEASMLVDNAISNARKNGAETLDIIVDEDSKSLKLKFVDNGNGLTKEYSHDMLFEAGITTTGSSGIGLYQARKIAKNLDALISIKDNAESKGVTLQLEWEKCNSAAKSLASTMN